MTLALLVGSFVPPNPPSRPRRGLPSRLSRASSITAARCSTRAPCTRSSGSRPATRSRAATRRSSPGTSPTSRTTATRRRTSTPLRRSTSAARDRRRSSSRTTCRFKTVVVDTKPFPRAACKNYTLGDAIDEHQRASPDGQIEKKLKAVIAAKHLPTGLGHQLLPLHAARRRELQEGPVTRGRRLQQPAAVQRVLRVSTRTSGRVTKRDHLRATCRTPRSPDARPGQSPNGNAADSVLNNVAHEHNESMADPLGNAWYDNTGHEIADKCHLTFGQSAGRRATGQYNQVINGHGYWLQQLWSNRAGGCVQRNTFPQPVASFTLQADGTDARQEGEVHVDGEGGRRVEVHVPLDVPRRRHRARRRIRCTCSPGRVLAGPVTLIVTDSARRPDPDRQEHHGDVATDVERSRRARA